MAGKNTVERIADIIKPFADELGLDIWDVRFVKEGSQWYLRVFIDKDGGVSVDDCVNLTRAVTKSLDEADPIKQSYMLEVSSPGIERELVKDEHFEKFVGSSIILRTIRPIDNVRDFTGKMTDYQNGEITLVLQDSKEIKVNKKDSSFVKLDDFDINDFKQEF